MTHTLIWGVGRHGGGLAAARWCRARGDDVRLLDRLPLAELGADGVAAEADGFAAAVGGAEHPWFSSARLVVASPAIPPRGWPASHPPRTSPEALALAAHHGPRVAVTGTKGKSTTARILGCLLGWEVAGNSYEPLPAVVARCGADAPLVIELSSFQLWYLGERTAPRFDAAVLTNLGRDHLDWHDDLAHYHASKLALLRWSTVAAVGPGGERAAAERLPHVTCTQGVFRDAAGRVLAQCGDLGLLGVHNADNACLALAVALHLGVPQSEIAARLRLVRPLPHRLETVHVTSGHTWIDDSIATVPEATMAALAAIGGPLAVILGGSDKGATWQTLAGAVAARGAIACTIGRTGPALAAALCQAGATVQVCGDLATAVAAARRALPAGGTVLLSPACASLDQFRSFEHRGDVFAALARSL